MNATARGRKTVLLIEDDESIRDSLTDALRFEGLDVVPAKNGKEGLDKLRARPLPNIVLLDIMMPVMNGFEFLGIVQKDPGLSYIPVIVLSANATTNIQGARAFIRKPIPFDELLDAIAAHAV